jgi:hypothetical protein
MLKEKLMIIELPQFEFENSNSDSLSTNLLFGILREFLDKQGIIELNMLLAAK